MKPGVQGAAGVHLPVNQHALIFLTGILISQDV
jgi:hypothetical protein